MATYERIEGIMINNQIVRLNDIEKYNVFSLESILPYDYVEPFIDGLARVMRDNLWGYINEDGEEVIPCIYESLSEFSEGYASFSDSETQLFGFMDMDGNIVIPNIYHAVDSFESGMAGVMNKNGLWGFIDIEGNEVVKFKYEDVSIFSEGYAFVQSKTTGLWGFINKHGVSVVTSKYKDIRPFAEGLAAVQSPKTGLWGYIDYTGKIVIPMEYDYASSYINGFANVRFGEAYFIIDKTDNVTDYNCYEEIDESIDDPPEFDEVVTVDYDGNGKYMFKNLYRDEENKKIVIKTKNKIEIFDKHGKIEPLQEQELSEYSNFGMEPIVDGNKKGFVNQCGYIITAGIYKYDPEAGRTINYRYAKVEPSGLTLCECVTRFGLKCNETNEIEWFDNVNEREDFYKKNNRSNTYQKKKEFTYAYN